MSRPLSERIELRPQSSLRDVVFDNHVFTNEVFRSAYDDVCDFVLEYAKENGLTRIVEMGAGTAPITQRLADRPESAGLVLAPCDRTPHVPIYNELRAKYANVEPIMEPVDFTQQRNFGPATLLLLVGTFPYLPKPKRPSALKALTASSDRVMIWEHVRRTPLSMMFASLTFLIAYLLPLARMNRPGRFRRIFWCWICPVVPFMVSIDGVMWCLRMWTDDEWREQLKSVAGPDRQPTIRSWVNSQVVIW